MHSPIYLREPLVSLFLHRVCAGFPSPADDYIERGLDLNAYLVRRPTSTFFLRVEGESMREALIHDGDIIVVDRAIQPRHGAIVVVALDGELVVRKLQVRGRRVMLVAANDDYPPIHIGTFQELHVWGVVTGALRRLSPR